jgi:TonB-linked SusC/RagA family outer membrane protein
MKNKITNHLIMLGKYTLMGIFLQSILYSLIFASDIRAQRQQHTSVKEIVIEVGFANSSLPDVINKIQSKTGLQFFYYESDIKNQSKFKMSKQKLRVSDLLLKLSAEYNLSFKQVNSNITVRKISPQQQGVQKLEIVIQTRTVSGTVTSPEDGALPGVNVIEKGTINGTVTDLEGNYALEVADDAVLVFSSVGYAPEEVQVNGKSVIDVEMNTDFQQLEEIVVVGYGQQKKKSVVGSIVQASSETLERTGGVPNLGQALTGQLPGVTTIQTTGEPGEDDPVIFIRGQSTWNNAEPLILVDGIERRMNDIDMSEVKSVSVLKDASATAVYGVKGAEGVILITTKRGVKGKPKLSFGANTTVKTISSVPNRLDSYESFLYKNRAIEYELAAADDGWGSYVPLAMAERYRLPQAPGDEYIFPNVDWADEVTKDYALSHRANVNITGGTDFAKYFGSFAYLHDADIMNSGIFNGRPYDSRYSYDRFNFRTNLDLNLTNSTILSVNLAGFYGIKQGVNIAGEVNHIWGAFFSSPPDIFPVQHQVDPEWGYPVWGYNENFQANNPLQILNQSGVKQTNRSQVTTDFKLQQKLDFITKGLDFQGLLSYDNRFYTEDGIWDRGSLSKFISPEVIDREEGETIEDYTFYSPVAGNNDFDFTMNPIWYLPETSDDDAVLKRAYRRLFYQLQMNYTRTFQKHDVSAMGLFIRETYATGSQFPFRREDWVGRVTYGYDNKYLFEANGAYNGSEKFGDDYKFGFFPSVAVGWVASEESFIQEIAGAWLNNLKIRYSYGLVGNDRFNSTRWLYPDRVVRQDDRTSFGVGRFDSPFTQYEILPSNPFIRWEEAAKQNLGIEMATFDNMISVTVEVFRDERSGIFIPSGQRNIADYSGYDPVAANLGESLTRGYEFTLNFTKSTQSGFQYWANVNFTHAKDEILYKEDPVLLEDYRKKAGYQIDQTRSGINDGIVNNWDEVYASAGGEANNHLKLPGDYFQVDYNADGIIGGGQDNVPFAFPQRPQNTYNFTLGFDFKGVSVMAQFYGVYNVSMPFNLAPFDGATESTVFENIRNHWTPENTNTHFRAARFATNRSYTSSWIYDGSYLRFKTAELAYTFDDKKLGFLGANRLKLFINGNNLVFWSDLPDDRETGNRGYPMFRRFNLGLNLDF